MLTRSRHCQCRGTTPPAPRVGWTVRVSDCQWQSDSDSRRSPACASGLRMRHHPAFPQARLRPAVQRSSTKYYYVLLVYHSADIAPPTRPLRVRRPKSGQHFFLSFSFFSFLFFFFVSLSASVSNFKLKRIYSLMGIPGPTRCLDCSGTGTVVHGFGHTSGATSSRIG